MPDVTISINGQTATIPGVYVNTQITPTAPSGVLPTGPLIFVAQGYGGVPFVPQNFTDAQSLLNAMRGAPSSDFVNFMFNPSTELFGTTLVTYINVAPNTQSSATIVSSGFVGVINLTSTDYGTPSNAIQYSIAEGSIEGVAMSILDGYSGASYFQDNLGVPFQLAYTGTHSGVTYSVISTVAGAATSFVINSPGMGESVTLDLTSPTFATLSSVIQYLNGTGFYVANVIGNGNLPSAYLDVAANISLPAPISTVDQYVNVTATLGDIVYFINNSASSIATASIATGITSGPGYEPLLTALQFFGGATNGVASLANYASGLNVALTQPAWCVVIDKVNTQLSGIEYLGAQHAFIASSPIQRKWRRYITGSALGESPTTAQTNARALNEIMTTYCWPGIQASSTITGNNQTYDGNHVAAAVAGIMTGNPVVTPVTNVTLDGNGVEQLVDVSTIQQLQNNGVLVLDYPADTKIPTLLSDVDTWQNDDNPANVFNQQVACRFALSYYLVRTLQPYVGTVASNFTIVNARNATIALLNQLIYNGQNGFGLLNSWDPNSLVLSFDGNTQTLNVAVSVVFVGQNRFIVVTVTVNPLNISVSSQGVVTNS
jgi:hypothetical protein